MVGRHSQEILNSIAANVRREREKRGLTQEALAEAADLGSRFVQQVEGAAVNLSIDPLVRLADALEIPVVTLFRKADLPPKRGRGRPPVKKRTAR